MYFEKKFLYKTRTIPRSRKILRISVSGIDFKNTPNRIHIHVVSITKANREYNETYSFELSNSWRFEGGWSGKR